MDLGRIRAARRRRFLHSVDVDRDEAVRVIPSDRNPIERTRRQHRRPAEIRVAIVIPDRAVGLEPDDKSACRRPLRTDAEDDVAVARVQRAELEPREPRPVRDDDNPCRRRLVEVLA